MSVYSKLFWLDTTERAIKTIAQSMAALLSAGAIGLLDVQWAGLLSVSGLAGLISILTSIASSTTGNSASLIVDNVREKA